MARELQIDHAVAGDPALLQARFVDDPALWLPAPARWRGQRTWTATLRAGPVRRQVDCKVGPVWAIGAERWRSLRWTPMRRHPDDLPLERALPTLRGELGLAPRGDVTVLVLHATYQPPAGVLGTLADSAGLHAVARSTGAQFLEAVAGRLACPAEDGRRAGEARASG